jgi:MYXO-CTERM domain-containing protein
MIERFHRCARALMEWAVPLCVVLACSALCAPAHSAPPSQWSNCASCHAIGGSASNPPNLPPTSNIVPAGAGASDVTNLRSIMAAVGGNPMSGVLGSISNSDLDIVRLYLIDVRDGRLDVASGSSTAFGSVLAFTGGSVQTFNVTNDRGATATFASLPSTSNSDFTIVGGGSCPTSTATLIAATSTCTVKVQFTPAGVGARNGSLRFTLNSPSGITSEQVALALSGTGLDPAPVFTTGGFAALTSPGFTAATNGTQTMCPTISNTGLSNPLTISLSIGQASGASADYSSYYELTDLSACSGGGLPALCVPAASSVTGSTSLASGASCTLPIKFDPAKFGFAGGTGARSAKLTVTHNAPTAGTQASFTLAGNVTTGPQPAIGISTTPGVDGSNHVLPVEFANQVLGTTSAQWNQFVVSNIGTADGLSITSVTQTDAAEFALTENCTGATLARLNGGSPTCSVALTFTPAGLNQRCTTVTVHATFSSNGDQSVTVCGNGVPVPVPQMSISRSAIAFGTRSIGAVYQTEPLTISNAAGATAALQIGAITLSGGGFAFVPDASACQNRALAAGTSCTLQLQFTPDPNLPGTSYAASVAIASNDPTTPNASVALSAIAVAYSVPALQWQQIASTTLSFPGLVIAGQSSAQPLIARLANPDGPGAVDVQAVRLVGVDASSFTASSCPALLYQGQFCDISITFMPGSGGQKTAQLQVVSTIGVAPPLLTVQGQGIGGSSPYLIVSTNSLAFGTVRVGARSDPLSLRLSAGGDGVLQVTSISAPEPFNVVSQTCPSVPFTLPVGADCSVTVTFTPTSASDMAGKLSIGTDAAAQPPQVNLDGTGQSRADVSSGGCSIASGDSPTDPTLWLLALLAVLALMQRRRWRSVARANGRR